MATFEQYKKKDGSKAWMFKAYLGKNEITGKDIRTTRRGFKSKRQAQDELNKLLVEFKNKGGLKADTNLTYDEAYKLWLETYRKTVKESTLNTVIRIFDRAILKKLSNQKISNITPKYCQQVANAWSEEYEAYDQYVFYASSVLEHAYRLDIINQNPFKKIAMPKNKKRKKEFTNYYDKDELEILLNSIKSDKQFYANTRLMVFSGTRIGECSSLVWSDVDFENKTIDINKTLTKGLGNKQIIQSPKTKSSIRKVSIDEETLNVLKKWKHQQKAMFFSVGMHVKDDSKQLLFSNSDNTFLGVSQFSYRLSKSSKKANLKHVTPHGLRHSHASLLFEAGVPMKDVQERLGHSSIKFTSDIYTHLSAKRKDETANTLYKFANF